MSTDTMQAIRFHEYGDADKLVLDRVPRPEVQPQSVLVRVHAAGVNPYDWKMRAGAYKERLAVTLPYIPGIDWAGVIEEVGAGVTGLRKGQAAYGTSNGGSYAEYVVVAANNVAPKPPSLTFVQAAGVPVGALTAWSAVIDTAHVEAGQQVFVQGGAGGVGSYAVQLARWKGAHVTATASERNLEFVRGLGAGKVIDYSATAFESVVHHMDVVIDTVGGGVRERSWQVLRPDGFLVTIVGLPSQEAAQAHGVRAAAVVRRDPARTHEMLKQIGDLIEAGQIKVEITHTFPLAQAAQAQERGERGHGRGRIVLLTA